MRTGPVLAFASFTLLAGPGWSFQLPATNAPWPTQHQREIRYADSHASAPYAMNYSDEAAERLGVRDGRWEAFDTRSRDPLMPSLHGGIDNGRAAISLQWRPGE